MSRGGQLEQQTAAVASLRSAEESYAKERTHLRDAHAKAQTSMQERVLDAERRVEEVLSEWERERSATPAFQRRAESAEARVEELMEVCTTYRVCACLSLSPF